MKLSMPIFNTLLLPLAILLVAHAVFFAWRAIPPASQHNTANSQWQTLAPLNHTGDVRQSLLAGGYWGVPAGEEAKSVDHGEAEQTGEQTPAAVRQALVQHLQARLQGIIYRGEWVLLFAQEATGQQAQSQDIPAEQQGVRPLELRAGEQLPGTHWSISQVWPDRIELQHPTEHTITLPLYPLADPVTEP